MENEIQVNVRRVVAKIGDGEAANLRPLGTGKIIGRTSADQIGDPSPLLRTMLKPRLEIAVDQMLQVFLTTASVGFDIAFFQHVSGERFEAMLA